MSRLLALALAGAAALAGCADTVEYEGKYLRIIADADLPMCGGTVAYMDDFYARLATTFGAPLPSEPEIRYRWMRGEDLVTRGLCADRNGCAHWSLRHIYIDEPASGHELVHIAAGIAFGNADPFFNEGLAVAFEGYERRSAPTDEPAKTPLFTAIRARNVVLPSEHYELAGAFTHYLGERYGLARLFEFHRATAPFDTLARTQAKFAETFGERMQDVAADFDREGRGCPPASARFKQQECSAPVLDWDGERLAAHFTVDCEDPEVVGPIEGRRARLSRTLVVDRPGAYRVELRTEGPARARLLGCGSCEDAVEVELDANVPLQLVELPAGRYALMVSSSVDAPAGVGVQMTRLGDAPREEEEEETSGGTTGEEPP